MKVAITGANGKVGQALISQLDPEKFEVMPIDLPDYDASIYEDLAYSTRGADALIHLAWSNLNTNSVEPLNGVMYENAYRVAVGNGIGLVLMGSSNHARAHNERESDGKIRYTGKAEVANNIYGVEKQKMEAMGRYFAGNDGLRVIALRIGNINPEDEPRPTEKPVRWMSHRDFGNMVSLALTHEFEQGHFEIVYGVSNQPVFDWVNSFGYEPKDSA